jgi:DNA-binding LacI/PurR family transcriptional regulator
MSKPIQNSLGEVARRCAVSQSTVSRVLNNKRQGRFSVSQTVRDRILQVAGELNYRPSVAARNLAASQTKLVAVLGVGGIWADRIGPGELAVEAASQVLDAAGFELCVQFYSQRHSLFAPPALRVDGVIVVSVPNVSDLAALEATGIPYVSINGMVGARGSRVTPDDVRGTRLAIRHLLDLGHRKIAYLDHWSVDAVHPSVAERRETFAACAREMNFEPAAVKVPMLPANTPWDSYYEPFLRDAVMKQGATAVLAYSHHGALALMRVAHDVGLSVPKDFSLACFNNEPAVQLSIPSLTAVDVPAARMGQVAGELLLRQMAAAECETKTFEPLELRLEETLIVRESTAPPGGRDR